MRFFQRMALLAILCLGSSQVTFAQQPASNFQLPRFVVNTPAGISGSKQFTWSGHAATGLTPWGRLNLDSVWINVPVAKAYDTLGISPLVNTNGTNGYPDLHGKFALILRGGGVSFSQKAAYCQAAGAIGVIIVNHKNGGLINMAPTAPFSAQTTVPVIFLSEEDGAPMNAALKNNQPVTISLSRWGYNYANDLGFTDQSPAVPHAFSIPLSQVNTGTVIPRQYQFYNGAFVANFGTANQTNVKIIQDLIFTPTGGTASNVYTDTIKDAAFSALDSVKEYTSTNVKKLNFSSTGHLNMSYTLSMANADQNPIDNKVSYDMQITDSIFCKSSWNYVRNTPFVSAAYKLPTTLTSGPTIWGPLFYVTKGGYQPSKAELAIVADSDRLLDNTVEPPNVMVYLFKWKDNSGDGLVNGDELSIVAVGTKTNFASTDSSGKTFTVPLINSSTTKLIPRLESNTWYYLSAAVSANFRIGADGNTNYGMRSILSTHVDSSATTFPEFWAPMDNEDLLPPYRPVSDTLFMLPLFNKNVTADRAVFDNMNGLVPAMALHISKNIPTNVETNNSSVFNKLELYPIPAGNLLNVDVELAHMSNIVVGVVNSLGQSMLFSPKKDFSTGRITINTASYPSGNYYLIVGNDNSSEVRQFTVRH